MAESFIVRPIDRRAARVLCALHPHAETLPNSSKYYMRLDIDGRAAGLAVWGYGIVLQGTPKHLFGDASDVNDYLELCRFFVFDWCPKNTASRFLATTHRIINKHAPQIKWLYTYAAGFQGLVGHIYKAAGYDYLGPVICKSFVWVPGVGLIHAIAQWHRYGKQGLKEMIKIYPEAKRWCGLNFRYLYWLCDQHEKKRLLSSAQFTIQAYPTLKDLSIWTEDLAGNKHPIEPDFARTIPIVKLKTKRAGSAVSGTPAIQAGGGGATPTSALINRKLINHG